MVTPKTWGFFTKGLSISVIVLIIFDKKAVDVKEGINMGIKSSFLTLRMRKMVAQIKESINKGEFKIAAIIFYF